MKKFFEKIKSYSFWVSLSASLILLLNSLGKAFGFEIENQVVEDCVMSIAGLLAVFGVVSMNGKNASSQSSEDDMQETQNEENLQEQQQEIDAETEEFTNFED